MGKLPFYNPVLPQSITALGRKLMKNSLIDISAVIRHETDSAYLLYDGRSEVKKGDTVTSELRIWVPKSQVENNEDGTFTMPEWLAKDKGFI